MDKEQAEQLATEIQEAMGDSYTVTFNQYPEQKGWFLGLWTRRNPEVSWFDSQAEHNVTTFSDPAIWERFKQAARVLVQNEQEKQMEEKLEEMEANNRDWCSEEVLGRTHP